MSAIRMGNAETPPTSGLTARLHLAGSVIASGAITTRGCTGALLALLAWLPHERRAHGAALRPSSFTAPSQKARSFKKEEEVDTKHKNDQGNKCLIVLSLLL